MASSPRIDELKKKFDENPRRYFAPLANEYRKAGDLEQAIQLCRAYLPQQPGHMSGHIVFGQALFESGQLEEAKGVFETALGLDPENLIALRHLGDIARQGGDLPAAKSWYQRVLEADPRNEEIAAQLATIAIAVPAAPPAPAPDAAPSEGGVGNWGEVNPDAAPAAAPAAAAPSAPAAAPSPTTASLDSFELRDSLGMKAVTPPLGAPAAPPRPPEAQSPELERDGEGAFALPSPEAASRGVEGVERSEEVQLQSRQEASRDDALVGHAPAQRAEPAPAPKGGQQSFGSSNEFGFETMEFVPPSREGERSAAPVDSPGTPFGVPFTGESTRTEETPAAFVTETMAELYLQQGFTQEALAVYRQLLAKNPNDAGLRERVDSLEHGARSSVSVAAVSDEVIEHAEQRRTAREPETIRSFFSALMRRRVLQRFIDLGSGVPSEESEPAPEPPDASTLADVPSLQATDEYRSASRQWADAPAEGAGEEATEPSTAGSHGSDDAFIIPEGVSLPPGVNADEVESTAAPIRYPESEPMPEPEPEPTQAGSAADAVEYTIPQRSAAAPPPAAEGTIDQLFGGHGGTSDDERAAGVLSGAFPAVDTRALEGRPAERAKTELSLDHVFREAERKTRASGGFSFDQFFSEGGAAPKPANRTTDPGANAVGGPDLAPDDDVAQFNSWLTGLKKK